MSGWRERLSSFDREVLHPSRGTVDPDDDGRPRYVAFRATFGLPLVGGTALVVVLTVLELAFVRRPLGTVAFLVAGLLLGLAVGTATARTTVRLADDPRAVPELPAGAADVVAHRTRPRAVAVLALVAALTLVAPLVLDFPTPFGPFAAALAMQSFLGRRAVDRVEAAHGHPLLAPAGQLTVEEDGLRWGPPAPA